MNDGRIIVLDDGKSVLAENGPLRLIIQAFSAGAPMTDAAIKAGERAFERLAQTAAALPVLSRPHGRITILPEAAVPRAMVESVRLIGDEDLTPMAAVAGTLADDTADHLFSRGATKVIVDNGGDVSIRLSPYESALVGLRPAIESSHVSHTVLLESRRPTWGVNTSGLGGRSLTRGIASAVTVFARTSSIADAAATALANACYTEHENIRQAPANTVTPHTDLGDLPVTVHVSPLPEDIVIKALTNAYEKATHLMEKNIIRGALMVCGGRLAVTPDFNASVGDLTQSQS